MQRDAGAVRIKFCGLTDPADVPAAILAGASYIGFVHHPASVRHLTIDDMAAMASAVPSGICKVVLTVDAGDDELDNIVRSVPLDMLQLHGSEPPERVTDVRARCGLPVMKAIGIGEESDLAAIDSYGRVADQLLVDTRPPPGAAVPGGTGRRFDWRLIAGRRWPVPWMLAGGLTAENVTEALRVTGARQVDVSSGIESAPGIKDGAAMRAFAAATLGEEPQARMAISD